MGNRCAGIGGLALTRESVITDDELSGKGERLAEFARTQTPGRGVGSRPCRAIGEPGLGLREGEYAEAINEFREDPCTHARAFGE